MASGIMLTFSVAYSHTPLHWHIGGPDPAEI